MDRVRKTFFNPLATSKESIYRLLHDLPVGSAHPFSPERVLLCRTEDGITEIDVSSYPEDFFFNAVDLGEMGEILLRRMARFRELSVFADFQIMQAPSSTFTIPLPSNEITILAVSERTPTYYDFCFANAAQDACCWLARNTFPGIAHSGDILQGLDLLDYVRVDYNTLTREEICVFISGYQVTPITRFLGTHPALLVADHVDKILYIIPVPLDKATIGGATICCPLVIKRDEEAGRLICSILPTATTDQNMMCHSNKMVTPCFEEAIKRANFTITPPTATTSSVSRGNITIQTDTDTHCLQEVVSKRHAIIATTTTPLLNIHTHEVQVIRFGTGLTFEFPEAMDVETDGKSTVVLPCIFGDLLEGPLLLATGTKPYNIPFSDTHSLRSYYEQLGSIVIVVDERMTDNARNLAPSWRINAVFIVHLNAQKLPANADELQKTLNAANVNAVTALAGPQSLVLVRIAEKFFFYRGIANRALLDTSRLAFGTDVTSQVASSMRLSDLVEPRAKRIVDLGDENAILLPVCGRQVKPAQLRELFGALSIEEARSMRDDVAAAVPQLSILLGQKDLLELSKELITTLSSKIGDATATARAAYIKCVTEQPDVTDADFMRKKANMLGELRKTTQALQKALEPIISSLASMISLQASSKRTHDLKRLVRQAQIQGNVEATKSMTFETFAGYLEDRASEMGIMLLNIETEPYQKLLGDLKTSPMLNADECCELDNRILHLPGFDAGIIIEQSQNAHNGPLTSQAGSSQPTLAVPYLNPSRGDGSMLAWVCWDEFVNLESPYKVRWMEKCNDAHIAAMRIITRSTLSQAVASREYNLQPASPEIGQLMSSLLMASMSKLAMMRTSAPVVTKTADDTVTKLMRGLFANLLTIAGSGVRPLSMVWQLFGLEPSFDIPKSDMEWVWYERVVALYPYTGWPLQQFHRNLEKLLDKVIVRVVTTGENLSSIKTNSMAQLVEACRLRNIQLIESRTIITIFMRMLTTKEADLQAIAGRLLKHLPLELEGQTTSYTRMIQYLRDLAQGSGKIASYDQILASVYTKRSAVFAEVKTKVAHACAEQDWTEAQNQCQSLMDQHKEIASVWGISPKAFKIQNGKPYESLLNGDFGPETTRQILSDAERTRVPWQVSTRGFRASAVEPLDENLCQEILTGDKNTTPSTNQVTVSHAPVTTLATTEPPEDHFAPFASSLQPAFVSKMQKDLSPQDVCRLMGVSEPALRVFAHALNPDFVWEDLSQRFKMVILGLLENRSSRAESGPCRKLFAMDSGQVRQLEGA